MANKSKEYNFKFSANTSGLARGVNEVKSKLNGLDKIASKLAVGIGGAFAGFAVAGQVKDVIDYGDKLQKLSLRLGETTEDFSRLAHVGELSGVAFDSMTMALQRMQRRVAEAAQGTGEAKNALKELGLSAESLAKLSLDEQFQAIAQRISEVEDAGDKTRLAMKLFDSEGVKLIQTMSGGAAGIREMMLEADQLGKTVSTETAQDMAELNDTFTRLEARTSAASLQLTTSLLPAIELAANLFISAADAASRFFGELSGSKFDKDAVSKFAQKSEADLNKLFISTQQRIAEFTKVEKGGFFDRVFDGSYDTAQREISGLTANLANIQKALDQIQVKAKTTSTTGIASTFTQKQSTAQIKAAEDAARASASASQKAATSAAAELKRIASAGASVFDSVRTPAEVLSARIEELGGLLNAGAINWQTYGRAVQEAGDSFNSDAFAATEDRLAKVIARRSELLQEGAAVMDAVRTPAEIMAQTIERNTLLLNQGAISWETYGRAAQQARETFDGVTSDADKQADMFEELASSVTGWGDQFAQTLLSSEGKFSDFIGSIVKQLAQIAIAESTRPIFDAFANIFKSASKTVTPAAYGGYVAGGTPHLIGENGPELFVPNTSGNIVPNSGIGGAVINQTLSFSGGADPATMAAWAAQVKNSTLAAIRQDFDNRGRLSGALR